MNRTNTWEQYRQGLRYQTSMGFPHKFAQNIRFREGDQWPAPTDLTRHLPRPVFNIIDFAIRNKRSAILDQPASIIYRPMETSADEVEAQMAADGAKRFTDYAAQLWDSVQMDKLNSHAVDDAATNGTGVWHFYWDTSVKGGNLYPYIGEIRGESIDPLNLFVSNPQCPDIQKQDWVLVSQRVPTGAVKALAKARGLSLADIERIGSDSNTSPEAYDSAREEQPDSKLTVLTKYYRKNGEVVFDRCTESVEIIKGEPLTPAGSAYRIKTYPIAIMTWKQRKKCLYGIGEVEGLIPNQKLINFMLGMEAYSVQQMGAPKLVTLPNALKQPVTNQPGEHLIDYSATGNGIRYLNAPAFSGAGVALSDKVFELTRVVTGTTEVATGEVMGANMAASAILALQNQAKGPVEELRQHFWWAIEDIGRIWESFFKTYYSSERAIAVEDVDSALGIEAVTFIGTEYAKMDFALKVDVGASSQYSAVLAQASLDRLFDGGYITLDQYIELSDKNTFPFKYRLKKMLEQQEEQRGGMIPQQQPEAPPNEVIQQLAGGETNGLP